MKAPASALLISALFLMVSAAPGCTGFGNPGDVHQDAAADDGQSDDHGTLPDVPVDVPSDTTPRDTDTPDVDDVHVDDVNAGDAADTAEPDEGVSVPDVADVATDDGHTDQGVPETDACTPECGSLEGGDLRECGSDGCDGECGYCTYGFACNASDGLCIPICIPDCVEEEKSCGDDGCNGNCGDCGINYSCGLDFQCHEDICQPDCETAGKECGDDGCGGSCGTCGESMKCTIGGQCGADACYGVDLEKNTCSLDGQYLYICNEGPPQSLLKLDCYAQTGAECGTRGCDCHFNPWSQQNECIEKPPCVPDCEGKECGDDGCGGVCDTCDGGWACTSANKCRPFAGAECVWIDWVGWCWSDNWLYTCSSDTMGQGTIIAEDCTVSGKMCQYNMVSGQRYCGPIY